PLRSTLLFSCYAAHRNLHSFPTRRSSDLRFLRRLDWDFPGDQELHLVLDNYGTHKTPEVERWLQRHPRFVRHFIPTSSSWVNLRSEEHTSELQSLRHLVCRLLLEKKISHT